MSPFCDSHNIRFTMKSLYISLSWYRLCFKDVKRGLRLRMQKVESRHSRTSASEGFSKFLYREPNTEDFVRIMVISLIGHQEPLQVTVKRHMLVGFSHVTREDTVLKTVLLDSLAGGRCRGVHWKNLLTNANEWTGRPVQDRPEWWVLSATASIHVPSHNDWYQSKSERMNESV